MTDTIGCEHAEWCVVCKPNAQAASERDAARREAQAHLRHKNQALQELAATRRDADKAYETHRVERNRLAGDLGQANESLRNIDEAFGDVMPIGSAYDDASKCWPDLVRALASERDDERVRANAAEAERDAARCALGDLVASLPRCWCCTSPATKAHDEVPWACDAHDPTAADVNGAPAIRRALKWLGLSPTKEGGGDAG